MLYWYRLAAVKQNRYIFRWFIYQMFHLQCHKFHQIKPVIRQVIGRWFICWLLNCLSGMMFSVCLCVCVCVCRLQIPKPFQKKNSHVVKKTKIEKKKKKKQIIEPSFSVGFIHCNRTVTGRHWMEIIRLLSINSIAALESVDNLLNNQSNSVPSTVDYVVFFFFFLQLFFFFLVISSLFEF